MFGIVEVIYVVVMVGLCYGCYWFGFVGVFCYVGLCCVDGIFMLVYGVFFG